MRYLMLDEECGAYMAEDVTEDELEACDAGIWSVIDTQNMTTYYEGVWTELPTREENEAST